jgi:hypothetical protein
MMIDERERGEREKFIMIFYLGRIWRQTGNTVNNL